MIESFQKRGGFRLSYATAALTTTYPAGLHALKQNQCSLGPFQADYNLIT